MAELAIGDGRKFIPARRAAYPWKAAATMASLIRPGIPLLVHEVAIAR
jgi:hypothetical protein